MKSQRWRMNDIVDFEFLLEQDSDESLRELATRDSTFEVSRSPIGRRELFRRWLEYRREQTATSELPGSFLSSALGLVVKLICIAGLILGSLAAAQLLRYDGQQPVNVAAFLGWLILLQIALAVIAVVIIALRKAGKLTTESSLLLSLIGGLWSRVADWLFTRSQSGLSEEQRSRIAAFIGTTKSHRSVYGGVVVWPMAGAMQLFGICFNLAAVLTTLALVIFSDRAFGWQSAVDFSPEQIHQLTQTLALPWSWFLPESAPSLAQIAGSKIVLKDGIKQLATSDLVSWWPFLCLALVTYGLVPRIALWLVTWASGRRALDRLSFDHANCDRLFERLQRPEFEFHGEGSEQNAPQTEATANAKAGKTTPPEHSNALLLLSNDLRNQIDHEEITKRISDRFRLTLQGIGSWPLDESIPPIEWTNGQPVVVVLEEAWQPPIAEKLDSLRSTGITFGDGTKTIVALVGRPHSDNVMTAVKASEFAVWERQIRALGNTQVRVERLIDDE